MGRDGEVLMVLRTGLTLGPRSLCSSGLRETPLVRRAREGVPLDGLRAKGIESTSSRLRAAEEALGGIGMLTERVGRVDIVRSSLEVVPYIENRSVCLLQMLLEQAYATGSTGLTRTRTSRG